MQKIRQQDERPMGPVEFLNAAAAAIIVGFVAVAVWLGAVAVFSLQVPK